MAKLKKKIKAGYKTYNFNLGELTLIMFNNRVCVFEDSECKLHAFTDKDIKSKVLYKSKPQYLPNVTKKDLKLFKPKKTKQNRK